MLIALESKKYSTVDCICPKIKDAAEEKHDTACVQQNTFTVRLMPSRIESKATRTDPGGV